MKLTQVQLQRINRLAEEGYLTIGRHPEFPLNIANYSHKCQFEKRWDDITMMCRGLIYDDEGTIVARPFKKFFNIGESFIPNCPSPELPEEEFIVYDKVDGSLGILYWWNDKPYIATRGSFQSDQSKEGQKILDEHIAHDDRNGKEFMKTLRFFRDEGFTPLFEIVYPENRIVVDYGGKRQLVFLGYVDIESGQSFRVNGADLQLFVFPSTSEGETCNCIDVVKVFDNIADLGQLPNNVQNAEGYVIFYPGIDYRVKLKHDEYTRLHKLITGVNERRVWEVLASGDSLNFMLHAVPDEFYDFVTKTANRLNEQFAEIFIDVEKHCEKAFKKKNRKSQAEIIKKSKCPAAGFAVLDNKDFRTPIWKMLKPEAGNAFWNEA